MNILQEKVDGVEGGAPLSISTCEDSGRWCEGQE